MTIHWHEIRQYVQGAVDHRIEQVLTAILIYRKNEDPTATSDSYIRVIDLEAALQGMNIGELPWYDTPADDPNHQHNVSRANAKRDAARITGPADQSRTACSVIIKRLANISTAFPRASGHVDAALESMRRILRTYGGPRLSDIPEASLSNVLDELRILETELNSREPRRCITTLCDREGFCLLSSCGAAPGEICRQYIQPPEPQQESS